jgi:8-oxo-dGTP diphosphatase
VTTPGIDRRPTAMTLGRYVTFTCLGPHAAVDGEKVTSVSVVAFTRDGLMVAAELDRGPDLPGGHVQQHEHVLEDAVRREAWEEARIKLGPLSIVEIIESDYFGPDDLTYMVIYTAWVTELATWQDDDDESSGRTLLTPDDFLERYRAGRIELMRHLITSALETIDPEPRPRA